jgi:hypothetical protein
MANTGKSQECRLDSIPITRRKAAQTPMKNAAIKTTICQVGIAPLHKYDQFRPYGALNQKFCKTTATKNHYPLEISK